MTEPRKLPDGPLIAFYGDDFTGSSASMEATAFAGIETVLFLSPPAPERLRAFGQYRVIGVAGVARARGPAWMDRHLPAVFRLLADTGAPVIHYKVCSTFDSAPHIGSIGRAADIGATILGGWTPMIVADPGMGRYQAIGNLFAAAPDGVHRLDRHPVMSRHPVTPMDEADLACHLAKQTDRKIGLVDFVAMKRGEADARLAREIASGAQIVSLDVLDRETLAEAGRLVWEHGGSPVFGIGSQGFEAALVAWWRHAGLIPPPATAFRAKPADRIACVSGSVSPVTASQIAHARANGFATIALDTARAVDPAAWTQEIGRATQAALDELAQGRDTLVYSAAGPDDPAVASLKAAIAAAGVAAEAVNERIGEGLGRILDRLLARTGITRAVISGGDTSGRAAQMLGIDALTAIAPLAPGSPLCRAHAVGQDRDGLEIALKGGQVGAADFFVAARQGAAA
ncbi:four-carbon acid sugar kinase family protein [Rhodopila globiformis]|uniref:Type III effector n=1 Tax=Rhodopila globiformis TaxID=1071 RepID=A0A2S6N646_RHOGL|nr:four-carbon acid sugar kinase family protein [Rhodopila globiformis]PPQ30079.1 type III effector [Rhodopila globiformis]